MIKYDSGSWRVLWQLEGSVFPRALVRALPCAFTTCILHFILRTEVFEFLPWMEVGATVMSNFTFVLGFLIVFRVNHAYARWWEAGTLLQKIRGDWFNAYSSLLAFANEAHDKKTEVEHFKHTLARLVSLLYSNAIHCVSHGEHKVFECIDITGLSPVHIEFMQNAPNRCEVILQWIQKLIVEGNDKQLIKIAPPILSRVYNQLGDGIVDLNNARKIAEFPIPFPLEQMVTIMLACHVFLVCTVCAYSIKTASWAGIFSFVIIFSFHSINSIAGELEDPYGHDANDLPLANMTQDMNTSLITLLAARAMTVPPNLNFGENHRDLLCKYIDFDTELAPMASGTLAHIEGRDCKPLPPSRGESTFDESCDDFVPITVHASDATADTCAAANLAKPQPEPVKEPVDTRPQLPGSSTVSSKNTKTQKAKQTPKMNEPCATVEVRIDMPAQSSGQGARSCSTSDENMRKTSLPYSTSEGVAGKHGETANPLYEGILSAEGQAGQLEALPPSKVPATTASPRRAVDRSASEQSAALGTRASASSSAPKATAGPEAKFSGACVKSAQEPAERSWRDEVALLEVEASRQTKQLDRAIAVIQDGMTCHSAGLDAVSGKCKTRSDELPAPTESVNGQRDQSGILMPSGSEFGHVQDLMEAAASNAKRECQHAAGSMPLVVQGVGDSAEGGQNQGLPPLATGSAGRECVQNSEPVPAASHGIIEGSSERAAASWAADEGAEREGEQSAAFLSETGEYISDWL